jgi:TrmH family RNA methyltransferase
MQVDIITSIKNDNIKLLKKLSYKKYRNQYKLYLIEGIKIINEALQNHEEIEYLIYDERYINNTIPAHNKLQVSREILKYISTLTNPQGIIAAIKQKSQEKFSFHGNWIFLDGIADPSNAASIVRSADCAGFYGVIFGSDSVDIYNDKFLRASMGSNYHVKLMNITNSEECIIDFKNSAFNILGADVKGKELTNFPNKNILLIIGNESFGISKKISNLCDYHVKIPIYGKAESLNAACAAAVLMYKLNGYIR